jgi:hypothetical protein
LKVSKTEQTVYITFFDAMETAEDFGDDLEVKEEVGE